MNTNNISINFVAILIMKNQEFNKDLIAKLQNDILLLQGFKPASNGNQQLGLGQIESVFPNAVFPTGAIHEFICTKNEDTAATQGFLTGILKMLMLEEDGYCLYISKNRNLFPTALQAYGVQPHHIIFVDLERERDILWAMEEGLKCKQLTAVIAELREITFAQSRRLQLTVAQSQVTGFLLRTSSAKITPTACVARWKITPLESEQKEGLPGLGFPKWQVELLRVKNGNPGIWQIEWAADRFTFPTATAVVPVQHRQIG